MPSRGVGRVIGTLSLRVRIKEVLVDFCKHGCEFWPCFLICMKFSPTTIGVIENFG